MCKEFLIFNESLCEQIVSSTSFLSFTSKFFALLRVRSNCIYTQDIFKLLLLNTRASLNKLLVDNFLLHVIYKWVLSLVRYIIWRATLCSATVASLSLTLLLSKPILIFLFHSWTVFAVSLEIKDNLVLMNLLSLSCFLPSNHKENIKAVSTSTSNFFYVHNYGHHSFSVVLLIQLWRATKNPFLSA